MGIPILSVRDDQGNVIPIPAVQGRDGVDGKDGAAGPNLINAETSTPISGILMGAYGHVEVALANINYLAPSAVTTDAVYINLLDGHVVASAVVFQARGEKWLMFDGVKLDVSQAENGAVSNTTKMIFPPDGYNFVTGQILAAFYVGTNGSVSSTKILESFETPESHFAITTYMDENTNGWYYIPAFAVKLTAL